MLPYKIEDSPQTASSSGPWRTVAEQLSYWGTEPSCASRKGRRTKRSCRSSQEMVDGRQTATYPDTSLSPRKALGRRNSEYRSFHILSRVSFVQDSYEYLVLKASNFHVPIPPLRTSQSTPSSYLNPVIIGALTINVRIAQVMFVLMSTVLKTVLQYIFHDQVMFTVQAGSRF